MLLWYIKNEFSDKFHKFHTRNGVIKFKTKNDDTNTGPWKSVENPDDLHALVGDDFDTAHFNKQKPPFKILTSLPIPTLGEYPVVDEEDSEDDDDVDLPVAI